MKLFLPLILIIVSGLNHLYSQHYTAVQGSSYAGSLGVANNPASIVNTPYKWDVTLFGFQYQTITNSVRGKNFPSFLTDRNASYSISSGNFGRKGDLNFNLRLLNARISLNKENAIAFGVNIRGYGQVKTSPVFYTDSVKGPRSFLFMNEQNRILNADFTSSAWLEVFGTYGVTLKDEEPYRLNAAITLKAMKGVAGAFARVNNVGIESFVEDGRVLYEVASGNAQYGYSANIDHWNSDQAGSQNIQQSFREALTSFSFDLGLEYLVKSQAVTNIYDDNSYYDYEWKVGLALLDFGSNRYRYSDQSRNVSTLKENISGAVLEEKFLNISGISSFNDSLASIVNESSIRQGNFSVMNPARFVINVDRYISGNFYVNGELSMNLSSVGNDDRLFVREANLLTVTPRWETKRFGVFLPVLVSKQGSVWIGSAFKAGPLLIGTHNLLNALSKNKKISGGGYIALVIRPSKNMREKRSRQYDCPEY